jgi:hypothetical protein
MCAVRLSNKQCLLRLNIQNCDWESMLEDISNEERRVRNIEGTINKLKEDATSTPLGLGYVKLAEEKLEFIQYNILVGTQKQMCFFGQQKNMKIKLLDAPFGERGQ